MLRRDYCSLDSLRTEYCPRCMMRWRTWQPLSHQAWIWFCLRQEVSLGPPPPPPPPRPRETGRFKHLGEPLRGQVTFAATLCTAITSTWGDKIDAEVQAQLLKTSFGLSRCEEVLAVFLSMHPVNMAGKQRCKVLRLALIASKAHHRAAGAACDDQPCGRAFLGWGF